MNPLTTRNEDEEPLRLDGLSTKRLVDYFEELCDDANCDLAVGSDLPEYWVVADMLKAASEQYVCLNTSLGLSGVFSVHSWELTAAADYDWDVLEVTLSREMTPFDILRQSVWFRRADIASTPEQ